MIAGKLSKIIVWPLDRLGRTAAGLAALFEDLQRRSVGFEALRDKVDLSTAAGRLMANVLASVAAYENEVRSERIRAGPAVALANGKRRGGSQKGQHIKVTTEQVHNIRRLKDEGQKVAAIARAYRDPPSTASWAPQRNSPDDIPSRGASRSTTGVGGKPCSIPEIVEGTPRSPAGSVRETNDQGCYAALSRGYRRETDSARRLGAILDSRLADVRRG